MALTTPRRLQDNSAKRFVVHYAEHRRLSAGRYSMRKALCRVCFLLLVCAGQITWAQVGTDGSILGTVKDGSGAVVPGADVVIRNLETGLTKTVLADQSG